MFDVYNVYTESFQHSQEWEADTIKEHFIWSMRWTIFLQYLFISNECIDRLIMATSDVNILQSRELHLVR